MQRMQLSLFALNKANSNMHTPDFDQLNYELGLKYLKPIGFEYKNNQWSHITEDRQLSFCLACDRNTPHFKVKYLTLSLCHFGIKRVDMAALRAHNDISQWGIVQISPLYLEGKKAALWHYVNPIKTLIDERVYMPIYYGGKPPIVGKPHPSVQPKGIVRQCGALYISESQARKALTNAHSLVARQGLNWANAMTKKEVLRQLQAYNEEWFSEKQWIDAYKLALCVQVNDAI